MLLGFAVFAMGEMDENVDPLVVVVTTMMHAATAALTLGAAAALSALAWRGAPAPSHCRADSAASAT
jgi:hypothetical protein